MKPVRIIQLYPQDMNLYGDWGNTLVLKKRLEWRGYSVEIINHNVGDKTDFAAADILIGGGGQDAGQDKIHHDLLLHAKEFRQLMSFGMPMLLVCGMYQLFGESFLTNQGNSIKGANILPIKTSAGKNRLTGNVVIESEEFGTIVGYENHSGETFLSDDIKPLGVVKLGFGNARSTHHEGARMYNVVATYLHGPILPKNPKIADFLIKTAIQRRDEEFVEGAIDDSLTEKARLAAISRPR